MRIFTGAIVTETNTFSPIPTGLAAFELYRIQHGRRAPIEANSEMATLVRWREMAQRDGHAVFESVGAFAQPGGPTVRRVYESMRDELLDDLRNAMPVDVVLLFLHGAMVAQGYDDCEADILTRARQIAGPKAIVGAELDPHSHLTVEMLEQANVILAYDEYPHTDILPRGEDLYRLCTSTARGEIDPVMRVFDCRMCGLYPTSEPAMRAFVDSVKAERESGRILSMSLIHGFPWGDVPGGGSKCLAIADGDATLAQQTADRFGREFWSQRDAVQLSALSIDEALDLAIASPKTPVVLADVADNAGGGAPGDSTFVIRRILERKIEGVVSGTYFDPMAVQTCFEAGEGAEIDLRVGGKMGVASGAPLDVRVTVRALSENHVQQYMDDSALAPLGRSAWVDAGGVHLVLASIRSQVFAPDAFTRLGVPLEGARIIVVKSTHHFWGKFAPIAGAIYHVDSPGALQLDFANLPFKKRGRNYWPRVPDPFGA